MRDFRKELFDQAQAQRLKCRDWLTPHMTDSKPKSFTKEEYRMMAMRELTIREVVFIAATFCPIGTSNANSRSISQEYCESAPAIDATLAAAKKHRFPGTLLKPTDALFEYAQTQGSDGAQFCAYRLLNSNLFDFGINAVFWSNRDKYMVSKIVEIDDSPCVGCN